jgi:hypothetical protein
MTDMRATERLLEVIEECAARETAETQELSLNMRALLGAVRELRLRGDLVVRARDLEIVVQAVAREHMLLGEDEAQALSRLDGALGASL